MIHRGVINPYTIRYLNFGNARQVLIPSIVYTHWYVGFFVFDMYNNRCTFPELLFGLLLSTEMEEKVCLSFQ